jgi:hypothetical protein
MCLLFVLVRRRWPDLRHGHVPVVLMFTGTSLCLLHVMAACRHRLRRRVTDELKRLSGPDLLRLAARLDRPGVEAARLFVQPMLQPLVPRSPEIVPAGQPEGRGDEPAAGEN